MVGDRRGVVPIGRRPHVRSNSLPSLQSLPPLQRSRYAKKSLASKGAAPASVATPMRTDRAIKANTVVFMGEYLLIRRSSCERRQKRRRSNRRRHQIEIGSAVYDPAWG